MATSNPPPESVRAALERVLAGGVFSASPALNRLLRFLVEKTLDGRADELKEYTIGAEALGRGPAFDPSADTIVRVQARRLRAKLDEHYRNEGRAEPLWIRVPKGGYTPEFLEPDESIPPIRDGYAPNGRAQDCYLQGRRLANGRTPTLLDAVKAFEEAVAIDPDYALAHAALADAYVLLSSYLTAPRESMEQARRHAGRALELDDSLADAHVALGMTRLFYDWDLASARRSVRQAIHADPLNPRAHQLYATALAAQARFSAALAQIRRAQELDPLSLEVNLYAAWINLLSRNYARASEELRRILHAEPKLAFARSMLGLALTLDGRVDEGIDEARAGLSQEEVPWTVLFLQHCYALGGESKQATALVNRVLALADSHYLCCYEVGEANAVVGASDQAFRWLDRAIEQRSDCMVWLQVEPWMDNLRHDQRYADLLGRAGLKEVGSLPANKAARGVSG